MEYADDPEAGDQDLRFHLNAHTGSDRAHPAEPPPQEPGTPQYYPPPYQFQPGIYPQPAYFLVPGVSPNPVNLELRRVQSERRPSAPYPDPPGPSRGPQQPEQNRVKARSTIPLRERAHLTDCGLQLGNDWGCGRKAVGPAIGLFPVIAGTQKATAPARMHYIREMHISTGEAREDRARALDLVRELHISSREHLERAGYAYYGRPNSSFCGSYSQADFGGLSQYTPASQVYDPSQPGSSHHNAPSNILPQFGGQNRPAYNTSPWPHPVGDFIVEDYSSQPGIGSQNIGMPSTVDFLDI
nr:hypothetical protein Iba_scaffold786CG0050 [Ipomoea batatas]